MTAIKTDNLSSLRGWTQVPRNGTIGHGANGLDLGVGTGQDAGWDAANHLAVMATFPLASIGFSTTQTHLILRGALTSMGGVNNAFHRTGVCLFEDDSNFFGISSLLLGRYCRTQYATANIFGSGAINIMATAYPWLVELHWNNGWASVVNDHGDTLAHGQTACYASDDAGANWFTLSSPSALLVTPTDIAIYLHNGSVGQLAFSSQFASLTITAPLLSQQTMIIKPLLIDLYPPGAFPKEVDRHGNNTLFGDWIENIDAACLAAAQDAVDQLALEIFPQTAEQTLDEWEAAFELDTVSTSQSDRQLLATGAARAALPLTPNNLRAALMDYLNPEYGFWDHGTDDVLAHYDTVNAGNGVVSEDGTGLTVEGTSPAQLDWAGVNDARVEKAIVARDDTLVLEAEAQTYVVNNDTATCIWIRDGDNGIFVGVEDIGGTTRARARRLQDGAWSDLGDIAVPGATAWYQIELDADGLVQCRAGTSLGAMSDIATDIAITWRPRLWGVGSRNVAPWNTVHGLWQDIRIAYGQLVNNVELHEQIARTLPADYPEAIFAAFVHRDPGDSGSYRLNDVRRLLDRIKWGHTVITVGESDNFLFDDPHSLFDRDIFGK